MHTQVITSLRNHSDKVRIVLNKSDQIDQQQLMRVYGALMWSLGKVFKSPEVCKVYVGSFNCDAPIREVCCVWGGQVWGWGACRGQGVQAPRGVQGARRLVQLRRADSRGVS